MSNPYEIEHNIKNEKPKGRTRRPSMSSFFSQLNQVENQHPNNPHASPTPVDVAAAVRLLQDQFRLLSQTAPSTENGGFLHQLIDSLDDLIDSPPDKVGVPQSYLDELHRVPKKQLKKTDECPICGEPFLDDQYPLVVELPCHPTHRFDLDCVGPWLRLNGTCPLDRKELMMKKEVVKDDEDEEDDGGMYA